MWFKQTQILQLSPALRFDTEALCDHLQPLTFTPCLPSLPFSCGFVPPLEQEDAPLAHGVNGYMLLCLQLEEKILPATVVRQAVEEKAKEISALRDRKVSQKEKYALKDEIIQTLLPRAFSKMSRIYAYVDTKNNWLVLDTVSKPRAEKFLELLKKSLPATSMQPLIATKLTTALTRWLSHENYPETFTIEKSCVLSDPRKQSRVIRCQQQDLSANGIQWILKDGCEVTQLALSWREHVQFVLADDFSLRSIKFQDEVIAQAKELEPETKQQQFAADFFIMTEVLSALLKDLAESFIQITEKGVATAVA